jgi:hypothetical protein
MAGEGLPPTSFMRLAQQTVDGGPAPAMTIMERPSAHTIRLLFTDPKELPERIADMIRWGENVSHNEDRTR